MRLLPLLLFVCFVLYGVLHVQGKSKENVKKLLQKYIHHHKPHHQHKSYYHHVHHHHKHHHHHHHHHHPHHKHWHHHHHHHHHHKSFHQKLVEKLKKERQNNQQNDVRLNQKATKRESLPQLLVSLGKGFMQLGKHLGNNESHADVQAKGTAIKHVPTPKPFVDDHVITTQAANAFATPSPTSQYYSTSESDERDDIGGDALTSAPPTPAVSKKFSSFNIDSSESNYRERTVPHPKDRGSPNITPTPQSEPNPSPSPKTQDTFSLSKSKDKQTKNPTVSRIIKSNQDQSVMTSGSDEENEPVISKLDKAKSIDENRDITKPKTPKVKKEESIPNPSIEIPAAQARLLEHSPTESAIDGKEDYESSHNQHLLPSNEYSSPNLDVSESNNIDENSGPLAINATQNADRVVEPADREDDLSTNDETKGSVKVSDTAAESRLNKDEHAPTSIDNPNGDQPDGLSSTKSQENAQIVETKSDDFQSKENIDGNLSETAIDRSVSKESKTEVNSTASDEIMDGEVPPTEIENDHNSMDDLSSKPSLKPIDADAKPSSQGSDSKTDSKPAKPSKIQDSESTVLDGTTEPSSQHSDDNVANKASQESSDNSDGPTQAMSTSNSDNDAAAKLHSKHFDITTDQNVQPTTRIGSTRKDELASEPTQEYYSTIDPLNNSNATTQSGSTKDELASEPTQEYYSTTDPLNNSKVTTQSGSTKDELASEPAQEYYSTTDPLNNSKATTQSGSTKDELVSEPTQEYYSTTDPLNNSKVTTQSGSTKDELASEPAQEYYSTTDPLNNSNATTQSGSTKDELASEPTQEYYSTTDPLNNSKATTQSSSAKDELAGEAQPSSQAFNSIDGPVRPSNHGDDDITVGVTKSSNHINETVNDASLSTLGMNDTAGVKELATPGTYNDDKPSKLDNVKTEKGVEIPQVTSSQDSESFEDAPQMSPMSNSTLVVGDSGYSASLTTSEPNPQSKSIAGLSPLQSSDQKSDGFIGGTPLHQAPVYQTNTNLGGKEYDDTEGNLAQLSDVPVDEAFNSTGEHLNMEEDQNKITNNAIKNHEEHQEKFTTSLASDHEIEDGEVLPPTNNTVIL